MSEPDRAIAAVLLAAGTSSRYRAADPTVASKLVVPLDGVPLVRHAALAALASRARPIVVVTGHAASEVRQSLAGLNLAFAHNSRFAEGLSTSVSIGLAALPATAAGALMLLGDMPALSGALLDRLIDAFGSTDTDAVVPVHQARRGNPALLGRALFAVAQTLDGDEGAKRLLARARVVEVDLDDDGTRLDIDDPAALAKARSRP